MNEQEQAIADRIRHAVNKWSEGTERSQQKKVGISSLGFCAERLRRELDGQVPEESDAHKMFIGTAIGDYLERAQAEYVWPNAIYQTEVTLTLKGDTRSYELDGHPDVVIPPCEEFPGGAVIDNKAPGTLVWVERKETAETNYQLQRHLYAAAAHAMGLLGDGPLEDVMVGNVYYDRSGESATPHVQIEPYRPECMFEAAQWLDSVTYAFLQGEEAMKEPPRQMCEVVCGFFGVCRGSDTDVEGVIRDETQLEAITAYQEAKALESQAKKLKNQAQIALKGVEGHTPEFTVRWVQVGGGNVAYERKPYQRLQISKKK